MLIECILVDPVWSSFSSILGGLMYAKLIIRVLFIVVAVVTFCHELEQYSYTNVTC